MFFCTDLALLYLIHRFLYLFKGNAVNAVSLNEDTQRIVPQAVTSPRKSETDSLLTSQFSSTETRPNELTVVSPSMISRTLPSEIETRNIDEELQATAQGQRITTDSVEVITIDETIEETRNIQNMKASNAEEHVAKKLKYMEH